MLPRLVALALITVPGTAVETLLDARMADDTLSGIVFLHFKVAVSPR